MKKKIINIFVSFIFLLNFFLFPHTLHAKEIPPGTGVGDVPANILLMLDLSGSMGEITDAQIQWPVDVDVDSDGNIYVLEHDRCAIKKFKSDGTFLKSFGNCSSVAHQFKNPFGFAVNSSLNRIAVADTYQHEIKFYDLDLNYKGVINADRYPVGVEWDSNNFLYVSNWGSGRVQKKNIQMVVPGSGGAGFFTTSGTRLGLLRENYTDSNGNLYVADRGNNKKIFKFDSNGDPLTSWGGIGDGDGKFYNPWGVVIDSDDDVFVSDWSLNRIQKFDSSGNYSTEFGSYGDGDGELRAPLGLGIDSNDRIYIADYSNHRIAIFTNTGTWVENIGGATRRIDDARKVIKKFLSEDDVVANTNFGLMTWAWKNSDTILQAEVNEDGAKNILKIIDSIDYIPSAGTNLGGAMTKARRYFRGGLPNPKGGIYKSPKNEKAEKCENNYIIVIKVILISNIYMKVLRRQVELKKVITMLAENHFMLIILQNY